MSRFHKEVRALYCCSQASHASQTAWRAIHVVERTGCKLDMRRLLYGARSRAAVYSVTAEDVGSAAESISQQTKPSFSTKKWTGLAWLLFDALQAIDLGLRSCYAVLTTAAGAWLAVGDVPAVALACSVAGGDAVDASVQLRRLPSRWATRSAHRCQQPHCAIALG
jgi:hypothetical protein